MTTYTQTFTRPTKERIEGVCSDRFPTWATMNEKTKETYRRQAIFWLEVADKDRQPE